MTETEFKERLNAWCERNRNLKKELEELKQEFTSSLPIQPGDKFFLRKTSSRRYTNVYGWILAIEIKGEVYPWSEIVYNPPKSDGTRSKSRRVEYFNDDWQNLIKLSEDQPFPDN